MATYTDVVSLIEANLQTASNITAAEHKAVELLMADFVKSQWLIGDIKEIDCTQTYINSNFLTTGAQKGKGIGEREGWAICNGYNGTKNRTGRVSVGWGDVDPLDSANTSILSYPDIGSAPNNPIRGGSEKHVLGITEIPPHFHHTPNSAFKSFVAGGADYGNNSTTGTGSDNGGNSELAIANLGTNYNTNGAALEKTVGGGLPHNNMQPYIVTLFIQKIE